MQACRQALEDPRVGRRAELLCEALVLATRTGVRSQGVALLQEAFEEQWVPVRSLDGVLSRLWRSRTLGQPDRKELEEGLAKVGGRRSFPRLWQSFDEAGALAPWQQALSDWKR